MDFLRLFSFSPDQFSDPSLLSSLGQHREAGGGEWARVPGQNYTVQTVLVQPVPLPAGSSSSQIPWLGPSKSLEPRARGLRSPALAQGTSFPLQQLWPQRPQSRAGMAAGS